MKYLLITSVLFFKSFRAFADERRSEIKNEATIMIIRKYGQVLEKRLKNTGVNPSYLSWYANDCYVSITAGTYQENTWSAI